MKLSLTVFATCLFATSAFADELPSFQKIKDALISGKSIHLITNFSKCSNNSEYVPQEMSVGVFTPNSIAIMGNSMATSFTHFTLNNPKYVNRPVNEFVRYEFQPNGSVKLSMQVLDAVNYEALDEQISFDCKLGTGLQVYS